jgi:hypothetical protein
LTKKSPFELEKLMDFEEPSIGLTLGFDFNSTEHTQAELDLIADLIWRVYASNGKYGLNAAYTNGTAETEYDAFTDNTTNWFGSLGKGLGSLLPSGTLPVTDVRVPVTLAFTWSRDFSPKFTLGFKGNVGGGLDTLAITQTETWSGIDEIYDSEIKHFYITPDVSVGASFNLLPEHFALQAGLGIELFSYERITSKTSSDLNPDPVTTVENTIGVPTIRLAGGLSVNFTKNTALDMLVVAANVADVDKTKFTMQFTFKK